MIPHGCRRLAPLTRRLLLASLTALLCGGSLAAPATPLHPCPIDWSQARHSEINLSRFIDAPAGRDGFLRTHRSRIVRPNGSRIRFWGVNLTGHDCFPSPAEANQLAAHLARLGVNLVRLSHLNPDHRTFDYPSPGTPRLRADRLERLDYLLAQLKHHGIYSFLVLNPFPAESHPSPDPENQTPVLPRGAAFYVPELIELQVDFARQLLTRSNPHTGLEYRHDPAIAIVGIDPPGSLLEAWVTGHSTEQPEASPRIASPNPAHSPANLTTLYNRWLQQQLSPRALDRLRNESQAGPGGLIPRLTPPDFPAASTDRFQAEARFYLELEQRFFERMQVLFRDELNLQALLVGPADHLPPYSSYAHLSAQLGFDLLNAQHRARQPQIQNDPSLPHPPMVNTPLESPVIQLARTPVARLPFLVSDLHHPFPHDYAAETIPILTAYALLQDWDGIVWSSWSHTPPPSPAHDRQRVPVLRLNQHPVPLVNLQTCAHMWHRQDVASARRTLARVYPPEQLLESLRAEPARTAPFFLRNFPPTAPLQHATRFQISHSPPKRYPGTSPLDRIVSDRGQTAWHHADQLQGVVTVDTPRSQALVGFVRSSTLQTRHLAVQLETDFCALFLTSLDDQPIPRSARLLLSATGRFSQTSFAPPADPQPLDPSNHQPVLVEPVIGTVVLRNLGRTFGVRVRPLAANGTPLSGTFEARETAGAWSFPIGEPGALWYRIDVQRRKNPPAP